MSIEAQEFHRIISASVRDTLDAHRLRVQNSETDPAVPLISRKCLPVYRGPARAEEGE